MEIIPSSSEVLSVVARSHQLLPGREAELITPQASGRHYWRVWLADGSTLVAMCFEKDRTENNYFARIALFLEELKLPAPRVRADHTEEGWVVMEDVGTRSLYDEAGPRLDLSAEGSQHLYQETLRAVKLLHIQGTEAFHLKPFTLMHGFDESLYLWETNYFWKNCLHDHLRLIPSAQPEAECNEEFLQLAQDLSKLERVLIHRDFQSQNVQVRDRQPHLIDFQGMRFGLAEYDLASLLYDPYIYITESDRRALLDYYSLNTFTTPGPGRTLFLRCAAQRLMQACGAYGFLGIHKAKPRYLEHIPIALGRLRHVLEELGELKHLQLLLAKIPSAAESFKS
ncbi:MAG: phosphotransferase [Verrucomicrobiae bacterium]|nr:phosphotransferase [Verrucomicrobiae bacterium]